jgi:S1-C subfamily serine protease
MRGYDFDERDDRPNRPRRDREPTAPSAGPLYYGLFLALGMLLGGLGLWAITGFSKFRGEKPGNDPTAQLRTTTPADPLDHEEQEAVTLFDRVRDSVVNVDVVMVQQGDWGDQTSERQTSGGSGFIWDTHGRIVTNYHVVADQGKRKGQMELRVVLADRSSYKAELIGASPDNDLAVVQISAPK